MRLTAFLALVVACSDPVPTPDGDYTLRALVTQGGRLEAGVVSGCAGIRGRVFLDAVTQTLSLPASGRAVPLVLPAGRHGLAAQVIGPSCEVVAIACIEVDIAEGGSDDFTLELESISSGAFVCDASESCVRGVCGPGTPDASIPPHVEGGTDAGPVCGPYEHLDCFGGRFCVGGVVREVVREPQPCDVLVCPTFYVGTCPGACATRTPIDETNWEVFCEGTHERVVGDACTADEDCQPPAPVDDDAFDGRVFLGCDDASSLCQEVPPPDAPDLGAPCSIDVESLGAPGSYGVAPDESCAGGLCRFYRVIDECAQHGCGLPCEDNWDCPPEYTCDSARDWTMEGASTFVCLPRPGSEVGRLSCHEDK